MLNVKSLVLIPFPHTSYKHGNAFSISHFVTRQWQNISWTSIIIDSFLAFSIGSIWTTTPSSSWVPSVCCDTKITYSSSGNPDAFYLRVAKTYLDIYEQCPGNCVYIKYFFSLQYCSFHKLVYRIGDPSFRYYCLSQSSNVTSSCSLVDPICSK